MALNPIQQSTLEYLSSGEGTTGSRQQALNELISEHNFFGPTSEERSKADLIEFVGSKRGHGDFCDDGLNRFCLAVLGDIPNSGPRPIRLTLDLDLSPSNDLQDAVEQIVAGIKLLRRNGEGAWHVEGADLVGWHYNDWYYND